MKKLFTLLLLSFLFTSSFGQITSNNTTTDWNTGSGWSCSCVPNLTFWDGSKDTDVSHTKSKSSSITLTNNNVLTIKAGGNLTINGNLTMGNNGVLVIESGGTLTVTGNITYTSNATITSDGTLNVNGYMSITSNGAAYLRGTTTIGTYLSQNGPGDFVTDGTVNIGTYFDVDADGVSTIGGTVTVGTDWTVSGSGGATVTGFVDATNGTMNVLNDAVVDGTGTIAWGTSNVNPANSAAHVLCSNGTQYDDNALTAWSDLPFNPLNLGTCTSGALPIELLSFEAVRKDVTIVYQFETAMELNNDYFEIEVSNDIETWLVAETVKGAGNSYEPLSYVVYSDIVNVSYARLKQVDYDGTYSYSNIISLGSSKQMHIVIGKQLFVKPDAPTFVTIYNLQGQIIFNEYIEESKAITIQQKGVFLVRIGNVVKKVSIN